MVSWCTSSRSNIGEIITILYLLASSCKNFILGPSSADSANCSQGCFSRVQKANGIVHASCKHKTFTLEYPAASINTLIRSCNPFTWSLTGSVVGFTIWFCMAPTRTILGARNSSSAAEKANPCTSKPCWDPSFFVSSRKFKFDTGAPYRIRKTSFSSLSSLMFRAKISSRLFIPLVPADEAIFF